jgi:hypothetical protein
MRDENISVQIHQVVSISQLIHVPTATTKSKCGCADLGLAFKHLQSFATTPIHLDLLHTPKSCPREYMSALRTKLRDCILLL